MGGERATGTATVLFTDLAGSTELMARLGDERFDAVRTDHFDGLGAVVAGFDGSVVKNTGDGILATFASAVAALKAAVGLQQATRRQADREGLPLDLRVGLAVGEVSFDDSGDVFGTPVVEAARLVASAGAGQILCTGLVRAIAGSRAGHAIVERGPAELKGLPDPVVICEVEWAPADPTPPIELPSVLTGAGRIFVGRAEPLEQLRQRWKEAVTGERRVVLIGGEPGVGKTRLATALAQELHGEGSVVLAGRCDEDLGVPYQPLVEALRHYVTHASEPRLGRHRGELARLLPELPQVVHGLPEPLRSDPETERYQLFDAVASWLSDVSAEWPVLLVVDDLHWAAKPTLLLLRHVLRSAEPLRLLLVGTYRDSDVGRGHPLADLLADLPRLEGAERLLLSGLDVPEVATFIERAAGHEVDDGTELARAVWRETDGNAFFVVEVLRHLAESGTLEQRDGRWVLARTLDDLGVPQGVRDVVGRRLSRLSDEANRVLACASVIGLEFDPMLVGAASGATEEVVLAALEEATAARLVVEVPGPVPRNRFSHALVRATLYDELSAARRVAVHRKVAEAIEEIHRERLDDHLPALAHHWARASAPAAETSRAVEYARRAGDRALSQFANDEAAAYFGEALELLDVAGVAPSDARRLPLLIALGEAQRRAGDAAHRETLLGAFELAHQLGDAQALAEAALANTRGYVASVAGTVDTDRVAALEAAVAAFPPEDSALRARLLCTLGLELSFSRDWERRVFLSDEATAMARRIGDQDALADVLMARCTSTLRPDTLLSRQEDAAELSAIALAVTDRARRTRALMIGCRTRLVAGRVVEADTLLRAADESANEIRQPALQWIVRCVHVGRTMISGRLAEAERLAAETAEIGRVAGQRESDWAFQMQRFLIRAERGDVDDEIVGQLKRIADDFHAAGGSLVIVDIGGVLAAKLAGHTAEAQAGFDRLARPPVNADYFSLFGEVLLAQLVVQLGRTNDAADVYGRLAPYPEWVVPVHVFPTPSVSFHLGLLAGFLGRFDAAEEHFGQASAEHERIGAPTYLARTRLEWARTLLARGEAGDEERARTLLSRASGVAEELGLLSVKRDAAALLGPR